MNRRFSWGQMKDDIRRVIGRCRPCLEHKPYVQEPKKWKRLQTPELFETVYLDLKDFSQVPSFGYKYILVMLDSKTRWAEFIPLEDKGARSVANTFFKDWICRNGFPKKIKTDKGKEFDNQLLHGITVAAGTDHEIGMLEHHEDQAKVERIMRTIQEALTASCLKRKSNWLRVLPTVAMMYRCTVHSALCMSPFQKITGETMRMAVDVSLEAIEDEMKALHWSMKHMKKIISTEKFSSCHCHHVQYVDWISVTKSSLPYSSSWELYRLYSRGIAALSL
jgi:hypothetical protein